MRMCISVCKYREHSQPRTSGAGLGSSSLPCLPESMFPRGCSHPAAEYGRDTEVGLS